jgi:hypothetical protein
MQRWISKADTQNAMIIASAGLEKRSDVMIGCSLMAPNVRFPDHKHPPEKVYAVLSNGAWCNSITPWPGIGGPRL